MDANKLTIAEMVAESHRNSMAHGFWDGQRKLGADRVTVSMDREAVLKTIPEKLALIHSEVSEALECYRSGEMAAARICNCGQGYGLYGTLACTPGGCTGEVGHPSAGKPVGFHSELADILVRVADLSGALGIDLEEAVRVKMKYNATRPFKHGKVC